MILFIIDNFQALNHDELSYAYEDILIHEGSVQCNSRLRILLDAFVVLTVHSVFDCHKFLKGYKHFHYLQKHAQS